MDRVADVVTRGRAGHQGDPAFAARSEEWIHAQRPCRIDVAPQSLMRHVMADRGQDEWRCRMPGRARHPIVRPSPLNSAAICSRNGAADAPSRPGAVARGNERGYSS